jgi:hypothetical protein
MESHGVRAVLLTITGVSLLMLTGCRTTARTGAAIGMLAGAGIGQAVGGDTQGTLVGAAIGGVAGYMIGNERDKDLARVERARIRQEMDYATVDITNSNGSISRVRLRRKGTGYIGARGEYYDRLPSGDELRPVYGF